MLVSVLFLALLIQPAASIYYWAYSCSFQVCNQSPIRLYGLPQFDSGYPYWDDFSLDINQCRIFYMSMQSSFGLVLTDFNNPKDALASYEPNICEGWDICGHTIVNNSDKAIEIQGGTKARDDVAYRVRVDPGETDHFLLDEGEPVTVWDLETGDELSTFVPNVECGGTLYWKMQTEPRNGGDGGGTSGGDGGNGGGISGGDGGDRSATPAPTPRPTPRPTLRPTSAPTKAPYCPELEMCYFHDISREVKYELPLNGFEYDYYSNRRYSVECSTSSTMDYIQFEFGGSSRTERYRPYFLNGDSRGYPYRSYYLERCGSKRFSVTGIYQGRECFSKTYNFEARC